MYATLIYIYRYMYIYIYTYILPELISYIDPKNIHMQVSYKCVYNINIYHIYILKNI